MNKRVIYILGGLIAAAIFWWLASPLFIDRTVDEAFPSAQELAADPDLLMNMPEEERDVVKDKVLEAAAEMPDKPVLDDMPDMPAEPVIIARGTVVGKDALHQGSGTATIYELPDGTFVLRLENFEVTNGPDLHVFLIQGETMDGSIDLGSLKGNVGDQNYDIPAGTDISLFTGISIYCVPFHVTFATAIFS